MTAIALARGTGIECAVRRVKVDRRPYIDMGCTMLLSGMLRYASAAAAVHRLGEDLFPPGPYRVLATVYITGGTPDLRSLTRLQRAELDEVVEHIRWWEMPNTEQWALDLIKTQAARRYQPLLASVLRWTADEVEQGRGLAYLRRLALNAFDIALGEVPFDLSRTWEPA